MAERSGKEVLDWINEGVSRGAGEVLLTSIDNEGTRKGLDIELCSYIDRMPKVPLIVSGGVGKPEHIVEASHNPNVDAVAIADLLHYGRATTNDLKSFLINAGINVRPTK